MKKKNNTLIILTIMLILFVGCSPKINTSGTKNLEKVFKKVKKEQRVKEEEKINALIRKGEILEKIHQYNPYIKILNIYIPPKQSPNGTFYHSKVVAVPLIFKPIKEKYLNPYAAEKILKNSKKQNTKTLNTKKEKAVNKTAPSYYRQKTGAAEVIVK